LALRDKSDDLKIDSLSLPDKQRECHMLSNSEYLASDYQHTLMDSITIIGRGLHSGLQVIMTLMPAEANSGYVFLRRDVMPLRAQVPARWNTVVDTRLSTTVANAFGTRVSTIEHLLAALSVCGVHNARIVLDAPEVPIMDGSAAPFVDLVKTNCTDSGARH
jgi:UDP-3-O-[3-hydroxymyristoyl] N-acetylglucosamine deacetylase